MSEAARRAGCFAVGAAQRRGAPILFIQRSHQPILVRSNHFHASFPPPPLPPFRLLIELLPDSGLTNLVYMQMGLLLGFGFTSFCPQHSSYYGAVRADVPRIVAVVQDALK